MVRKKKERTRATFTAEQMMAAVAEVKNNQTPLRVAAEMFDVKFTTLRRYVLKERENANSKMVPNYAVRLIFTKEQEESLCDYVKTCSKMAFGLNTFKVRQLAYEMACKNNIVMPESWKNNKCASKDWLRAFIQRNPTLSLRKPEACSLSRLTSFTKPNVDRFFSNLEEIYNKHPSILQEIRIYNLDETGTTTVQRPHKVVAQKGVKQLNQCTSAERGLLATTCAIIRANGTFLPPTIVFPRKKFNPLMLSGAPPGTLGLANPSGWMTAELFTEVLNHFIKQTGTTKENPSLLILDNHESHVSLETAEIAKSNGVIILTLPPHTSNKLQPLDKSVFFSFKNFYNNAIDAWLLNHPGQPMTLYQIAHCVGVAHSKSMTPENIMSGFKSTGIYPFNSDIFTETDFLLSSVTDRQENNLEGMESRKAVVVIRQGTDCSNNDGEHLSQKEIGPSTSNIASTSSCVNSSPSTEVQIGLPDEEKSDLEVTSDLNGTFITPFEMQGFPKAAPRKNLKRVRKSKKSVILTSTPEMKELSYKSEKKKTPKTPAVKKIKRNISVILDNKDKSLGKKKKVRKVKEKIDDETDTETDESIKLMESSDEDITLADLQYYFAQEHANETEDSYTINDDTTILKKRFCVSQV
ncbi:hypothetical protein NQ315_016765 [Exocentrus adspersus]|uniref:DDE-1 domain-containing protein n=1 Tax=Exocentrus adspersus TaxID=1586481 RepID=A0AAV8V5R0_9CUCU|nr:hypothetical protein NQ315_016765 [Exocentrus adspersus]